MSPQASSDVIQTQEVTLLELLDRILDKGVVIAGDVVLSVADIPMIYLGLKILLTSVESMEEARAAQSLSLSSGMDLDAWSAVASAAAGGAESGGEER